MTRLLPLVLSALLAACGPSMTEVRKHMLQSKHQTLAVVPFDSRGGRRDAAPTAQNLMLGKLGSEGFWLDQNRVLKAYRSSPLSRGPAFERIQDAVLLGKELRVSCVLLGSVDDAFERVVKTPQVLRWDPVPPPACCYDQNRPCAHAPIYDPSVNHYVDRCEGTHRRVVVSRASTTRTAGLGLRLRLVDVATGTVLWEAGTTSTLDNSALYGAADNATSVLNDQLADAFLKRDL